MKNSGTESQIAASSVDNDQELELNTMDDFPEAPSTSSRRRSAGPSNDDHSGLDIGIPGVRFVKLPHKKGAKFNVGNPLAKDFLASVGEEGALASLKKDKLEKAAMEDAAVKEDDKNLEGIVSFKFAE